MNEATEAKLVDLACNALTVAGQEMGEGDHWPVIKATVQKIKADFEEIKLERAADDAIMPFLYQHIENMERGLLECTVGMRAQLLPKIKQLREICDAYFSEPAALPISDDEMPLHIRRAKEIVKTLDNEDGEA